MSAQRVIISAAAAGIGRVVAEAFIAQGARVHLCDVNDEALADARAALPTAVVTKVDLADGDAVDQWVQAALADLGGVDVLVNNAGIKGPTAFVEAVTPEEWRESLAIGALMNARGLMELIILNIGLQRGIIEPALFTLMVLMAIVTTLMASPIFRALYGPLGARPSNPDAP